MVLLFTWFYHLYGVIVYMVLSFMWCYCLHDAMHELIVAQRGNSCQRWL